ncbi:MAG TPA: hypothetical protein VFV67_33655 [Actinophytocola sp.]|uniref:hypothetical protein n=1 Tax=Actinophytocola sp. TaxID=1872138 RepID=UPI002DBEC6E2|nr:hypothetical protein [Actinophytocola sp.]HEU5475615.1 hypothetical protein [Actinophytocola sp.]
MVTITDLVRELKLLRKGRGVFVSQIDERIGPALREVCAIDDADPPAVVRRKVAERLEQLAGELPADIGVAVLAAFAICPEARFRLYQERVEWAATRLNRDPRTARRRVDDGIDHLAQLAVVAAAPPAQDPASVETGWHTAELRLVLALDRPAPEAIEQRRIVADRDGLTELDLAMTLAAPADQARLDAFVLYGGTLAERGMETTYRRSFTVALPRPLARGESHDIGVQFRLSDGRAMRPYFVCVPRHRCALFDLRVRFDRARVPDQISVLRGVFERDIDDPVRDGDGVAADAAGDLHVTFRNLGSGLAYGARWG